MRTVETIREQLLSLQDAKYKQFCSTLMPTVDPKTVIGIRTPILRGYAKDLAREGIFDGFLASLPHAYYEENNLHAFLIERIGDFDKTVAALDAFLPYIDNWATCDCMSPKILGKYPEALLPKIWEWMASDHTYTSRYAIGLMMRFYLDDHFRPEYPERIAAIRSDEYYVNMMIAWYFATALAKQYDAILPYIVEGHLPEWTHNKAIQKAVESRRITPEQKHLLRTYRIKKDRRIEI